MTSELSAKDIFQVPVEKYTFLPFSLTKPVQPHHNSMWIRASPKVSQQLTFVFRGSQPSLHIQITWEIVLNPKAQIN